MIDNIRWSLFNELSNSAPVRSVAIWFFIVPIVAKLVFTLRKIHFESESWQNIVLSISLPFQWKMIFFSALFFMIARIIYVISCPRLVNEFKDFGEFEKKGLSRVQLNGFIYDEINSAFKGKLNNNDIDFVSSYLSHYVDLATTPTRSDLSCITSTSTFLSKNKTGEDSDAFYFVYEIFDKRNHISLAVTAISYSIAFICLVVIAFENILYVLNY